MVNGCRYGKSVPRNLTPVPLATHEYCVPTKDQEGTTVHLGEEGRREEEEEKRPTEAAPPPSLAVQGLAPASRTNERRIGNTVVTQ